MSETFFKTLVVVAIIIVLFYLIFCSMRKTNIFEGLENQTPLGSNGEAGNASNYAANIKAEVIKMQDSLLITKYRKDYENAIINLEDLINFSMLKVTLNLTNDPVKDIKNIEALNTLNNAKVSLNGVMKFVDSQ
jgi:hypothetical protein